MAGPLYGSGGGGGGSAGGGGGGWTNYTSTDSFTIDHLKRDVDKRLMTELYAACAKLPNGEARERIYREVLAHRDSIMSSLISGQSIVLRSSIRDKMFDVVVKPGPKVYIEERFGLLDYERSWSEAMKPDTEKKVAPAPAKVPRKIRVLISILTRQGK